MPQALTEVQTTALWESISHLDRREVVARRRAEGVATPIRDPLSGWRSGFTAKNECFGCHIPLTFSPLGYRNQLSCV